MTEKFCSRCKRILPLTEYYHNKKRRDGLTLWCKTCCNECGKKSYSLHVETNRIKHAEYRANNVEKIREMHKLYSLSHREWYNARGRKWSKDHPEERSIYNARRRAKINSASGDGITIKQRQELINSYVHLCVYCGDYIQGNVEIDHIVPLSKGGEHSINNAVPTCRHCNASKNDHSLLHFMYQRMTYQ